jgi:hypothetical protein
MQQNRSNIVKIKIINLLAVLTVHVPFIHSLISAQDLELV